MNNFLFLRIFFLVLVFSRGLLTFVNAQEATLATAVVVTEESQAENLYKKYAPALYQVEAVSLQSNKRNSIGSAFQISKDGYIATNYHVVSNAVLYPEYFYIRVIQPNNKEYQAKIVAFDVIHDLAIVKITPDQEIFFTFGSSDINKGRRIFSLGDPQDLGMSIKEGLANGYMEKAIYQKILTSLSLNSGMSGGPTIDESGNVVGVNVSTAGNALSFLVPVEFLKELWQQVQANDYKPNSQVLDIQRQLIKQEESDLKQLTNQQWEKQPFGNFVLPTAVSKVFSCWGTPNDYPGVWLKEPGLSCASQDTIYISHNIRAHAIFFHYRWLTGKGNDPYRLFTLATKHFNSYRLDLEYASSHDAKNFVCQTERVKIANQPFWVSTCARQLKLFPQLYDINVLMGSMGDLHSILAVEVTLSAVTKQTAKDVIKKFVSEIEWRK